jgi:hypothetical protein
MIAEYRPIPERKPLEATHGKWPLLMGRKQPHCRRGDADLDRDNKRGAVDEGAAHHGRGLSPAGVQGEQGKERIEDGASVDENREHHDRPRETIDIHLVALPSPPKARAPALRAERTPERGGAGTSVRQPAPVKR